MTGPTKWRQPWLVAAWPGMGAVAQIAATHLAMRLGVEDVDEFAAPAAGVASVRVEAGLVVPRPTARSVLHGWRRPGDGHDLLVLLSERQPDAPLDRPAQELLHRAGELGVVRVVTFAAMGTAVHPSAEPRVFATATTPAVLDAARRAGAEPLAEGEIRGMNGVLLGAAADHGVEALGLLGEMPFFAGGLPNPRSAAAVLTVFARLADLQLDLGRLYTEADRLESVLVQHLPVDWPGQEPVGTQVAAEVRRRIEELFAAAEHDRDAALALKAELDRHGLFADYEDRFLDLFREGS